ncbi:MAG: DUF2796 domain-containing protein [Gammaproteobacteria bacterium]|nr:DUF2796 domain-containing protein [Gammaproteobacteria bacterium]
MRPTTTAVMTLGLLSLLSAQASTNGHAHGLAELNVIKDGSTVLAELRLTEADWDNRDATDIKELDILALEDCALTEQSLEIEGHHEDDNHDQDSHDEHHDDEHHEDEEHRNEAEHQSIRIRQSFDCADVSLGDVSVNVSREWPTVETLQLQVLAGDQSQGGAQPAKGLSINLSSDD